MTLIVLFTSSTLILLHEDPKVGPRLKNDGVEEDDKEVDDDLDDNIDNDDEDKVDADSFRFSDSLTSRFSSTTSGFSFSAMTFWIE